MYSLTDLGSGAVSDLSVISDLSQKFKHDLWRFMSELKLSQKQHLTPAAQIPQCNSPISHNAPFCNRNVHVCTFLLQNGALWDIHLMHHGICKIGPLRSYYIEGKGNTWIILWTHKRHPIAHGGKLWGSSQLWVHVFWKKNDQIIMRSQYNRHVNSRQLKLYVAHL